MPYDQLLAMRSRKVLLEHQGVSELPMFGGIAFKLGDHMFGGIIGKDLIVRLGVHTVLDEPNVRPMDFTGRPLRGIFFVSPEGLDTEDRLRQWLDKAISFVRTLPEKT